MAMTPQQEAEYAISYGTPRDKLSPEARTLYDGLLNAPQVTYTPEPADTRTPPVHDALAICAFIFGVLMPVLGIILAYVSLHEAKIAHRKRSGLAIAGLVIGWAWIAIIVIIFIAIAASAPDPMQVYDNCVNNAIQNGTNPGACPAP